MFINRLCILVALIVCSTARAQSETNAASELAPKSTFGSGFDIQYDGVFDPTITESSNSTIYGMSVFRNTPDSIYAHDAKMPMLKLTQTVSPLNLVGTVNQLFEATVSDALGAINVLQGGSAPETASGIDCTRSISGVVRSGKRFEIKIDGLAGFAECYSFETESGKGVGVTLKYLSEPNPVTSINESEQVDDILEDLQVTQLTSESTYIYNLADYPAVLPVQSSIQSAKQLSTHAVELAVQMRNTELTLQLINVPQEFSTYITMTDQVDAYKKSIEEQESSGALTMKWSGQTHIAVGDDLSDVVKGDVFLYRINDQNYYNTLYTQLDGNLIVLANFISRDDNSNSVHKAAKSLFKGSPGATRGRVNVHTIPGFDITLPASYHIWKREDATQYDEFMISNQAIYTDKQRFDKVYSRVPMTRIKVFEPGKLTTLREAHTLLLNELMNKVSDAEYHKHYSEDDLTAYYFRLSDGSETHMSRTVIHPALNTVLHRSLGFDDTALTVTSYLSQNKTTGAMCVISTISNTYLNPSADDVTIGLLNTVVPTPSLSEKDLGFARLNYNPFKNQLYKQHDASDDTTEYHLSNEHVKITIYVSANDPEIKIRSIPSLNENYMKRGWMNQTTGTNISFFPDDFSTLQSIQIAGNKGFLFEKEITNVNQLIPNDPGQQELIRVYGFTHKDRFICITMKQIGDSIDPSRLDQWFNAFTQ